MPSGWLRPAWPVHPSVQAVMTTREGGVSVGPFASMNLGAWVGDDPTAVTANVDRLQAACGARSVFLKQVHGVRVVRREDLTEGEGPVEADACVAVTPGLACTVTVADCLPVLFAAPEGRGVGAAHAGWRGLAGGVLERTVETLCEAASCAPADLVAWMGACIGPQAFEVGAEVLQGFGIDPEGPPHPRARASRAAADGTPRWLADLPGLAGDRLRSLGLQSVSGGGWCTVAEPSRFFSFRRDRVTGRMAASVWRVD